MHAEVKRRVCLGFWLTAVILLLAGLPLLLGLHPTRQSLAGQFRPLRKSPLGGEPFLNRLYIAGLSLSSFG